jgi:exopolysaccharide biosynthesis polyprenyl glycosylphosphotransferase
MTRGFYRWVQSRFVRKGFGRHRTLIVGAGNTGITMKRRMENHPLIDHEILGFIDDGFSVGQKIDGVPVVGGTAHLLRLVDEHEVDEVFFANPTIPQNEILNFISRYRKARTRQDVTFKVATEDMFQFIASKVNLEEVDNFPVVELKLGERSQMSLAVKRFMDVVIALFLLPFATLLSIFIIPLIKIASPGPAVFRHERIGKNGEHFFMYKFRTMKPGVDEYAEAPTTPRDPRVIPVIGRLLRRTSLDEIPQIINVLKGEMSMVGPRPEMPFVVNRYSTDWQKLRFSVKPGITGLWQIIGRKDVPLYSNLEYDYFYVQNQSLMLDILILLKTIPSVLLGKGAY